MKVSKASVLYIHLPDTEYQCSDCTMLHPDRRACSIHQKRFQILRIGSCGLFYFGRPQGSGFGSLTIIESGYEENQDGFSCKRCSRFLPERSDCRHVDKNSSGDDPGRIHPNACCNDWKRGAKEQVLRAFRLMIRNIRVPRVKR